VEANHSRRLGPPIPLILSPAANLSDIYRPDQRLFKPREGELGLGQPNTPNGDDKLDEADLTDIDLDEEDLEKEAEQLDDLLHSICEVSLAYRLTLGDAQEIKDKLSFTLQECLSDLPSLRTRKRKAEGSLRKENK